MVSSTPRPQFTPGKDPVPILQEAGWAPGLAWSGGKSRPHRDSIPDRPTLSQSLYRLSYRAHNFKCSNINTEDGKLSIENAGHPCVHLCTDFQEYEALLAVTMG